MSASHVHRADWRTPTVVLVASGLILTLSMGIRHGFGLFLQPMSADLHWGRETFALAMAVQNLMWGAAHAVCRHARRPLRQPPGRLRLRVALRARPCDDGASRRRR